MKRESVHLISIFSVIALLVFACISVSAAEPSAETIIYFEDGSYVITTVTEDAGSARASGTKSGKKERSYYNSADELVFVFRVHGSFTYTGTSVKATDADYSYTIYSSDWSFKSGSASYSGATATARGSFAHGLVPNTATVALTCSANGTLS